MPIHSILHVQGSTFLVVDVEYLTIETPLSTKSIIWQSFILFKHNNWNSYSNLPSFVAICSNT